MGGCGGSGLQAESSDCQGPGSKPSQPPLLRGLGLAGPPGGSNGSSPALSLSCACSGAGPVSLCPTRVSENGLTCDSRREDLIHHLLGFLLVDGLAQQKLSLGGGHDAQLAQNGVCSESASCTQ